jgi:flagellar assembly factor FliW
MQINTTRFGSIEVAEDAIFQFPHGLYGLEQRRDFCLLRHDEAGRFNWLQSFDEPALAMLVADPFQFFSDYEVVIADPVSELLRVVTPAEVTPYVTVTLSEAGKQISVNLLGPLVVNLRTHLGAQVIQDANRYTTHHPIGAGLEDGTATPGQCVGTIMASEATSAVQLASAAGGGRSRLFRQLTVPV